MPQDFNYNPLTDQAVNPQQLELKRKAARERGEVFPYEVTTVYATKKAVERNIPGVSRVGQEFKDVHVAFAKKLVDAGKASYKPEEEVVAEETKKAAKN